MKIDILSLFPEFVEAFFHQSMIKRALEAGLIEMAVTNPRDFTKSRHRQVDDTIYGGGAGMLMMCQPLFDACHHVLPEKGPRDRVIFLSPAGKTFNQDKAKELQRDYDHLVLICGHYEGVDHRVEEHLADELISIGDYVLTGGELGAMVISDAVARMVPGVLGDAGSAATDSFYEPILEFPSTPNRRNTTDGKYRTFFCPATMLTSPGGEGKKPSAEPWHTARTFWKGRSSPKKTENSWRKLRKN